jgi:DNA-3-methyladenine glycosylase II
MVFDDTFSMSPLAPFNFELSAEIFRNGDAQIRKYENGKLWQVIRLSDKLLCATITSSGTVEHPRLTVELKSNREITEPDKKKTQEVVCSLFNLDFNLTPFYEETERDKVMEKLAQRLCGLKSPTTQFAFEALTDSIIEQQISLRVANSLERKLIKKYGDALSLDGEAYYAYPSPQSLASANLTDLRGVGLSQRKAEYIKAASTAIAEGKLNLEALKTLKDANEIIAELDKLRGVGVWTAELTMLRGMQRLEALPADDLGLRRTISHYYCGGRPITSQEAREIGKRWGKWKGLAAYYLIVAEMLEIEA